MNETAPTANQAESRPTGYVSRVTRTEVNLLSGVVLVLAIFILAPHSTVVANITAVAAVLVVVLITARRLFQPSWSDPRNDQEYVS